jgi:hypothetical protein
MKKITLLMALLFISMTCIMAQTIAEYSFSTATNGSLVDMSSGTTDLLATGTYRDDNASAVTNIGFTFILGANTYTQFSGNSNGQMQLGATAISGGTAGPSVNLARLAPISGDNAIRTTGKLHYKVTGSSPNQVLVVEWVDLRVNYGNAAETGTYCKMQVLLYETTNQVKYIYGNMWNMSTTTQSRGIYLSTSNTAGSVGNIITINTTPTWNTTSTSVTNTVFAASGAMTNLNSAADGSRRVFTFLPPNPFAVPNAAISPLPAHQATMIGLNPTLTWASGGGIPTSYDVYFGPSDPPAFVRNQTDLFYNATNLERNHDYFWKVVPINANGQAEECPTWKFTTIPEGLALIGDGTNTSLNLPLNPFYGYNYSQNLYLQSEINVSGQRIEKLYYNWNGIAAGTNSKDWTIYMGHTTKTVFANTTDWVPVGDLNQVFSGVVTIPASSGWIEIVLNAPFIYNNADNLVIAINETTNGNDGSSAKFFGTSFTANRGLRVQKDGTVAYDPAVPGTGTLVAGIANIRMQFGDLPTTPVFSHNPISLAFPNIIIGNSSDWQNVTVSNIGQGTLTLRASDIEIIGTDAGSFEFDDQYLPADLEATESVNIPVRFNAPAIGSYTATLRMTYASADFDVALSGSSVAPFVNMSNGSKTLAEGETWGFFDSGGASGQYGSSENFSYTFNPPTGYRCSVDFTAFDTESGYDKLKIYDGVDAIGTLIGDYSGTTAPPSYTSILTGALTFVFTSDGSSVRDGWAASISSEALPTTPVLEYSPTALAFPVTQSAAVSAAQNVTISNMGGARLELGEVDIRLSGDDAADFNYDITNLPSYIDPLGSENFPVTFEPQHAGAKTATLVINYDSVDYEVALSGYAYAETDLFEGFEGAFPPAGWANPGTWSASTPAFAGTKSAYRYGSSTTTYILSTPKLELEEDSKLVFMARISSITTALDIVYSTDRTSWTKLGDSILAPSANTWFQNVIDLSGIPDRARRYYLGFRTMGSASYYVDNVIMPAAVQEAPEAVALVSPYNAATSQSLLPTLSWTPASLGGIPTSYDIYLEATTMPVAPEANPTTVLINVPASPYTLTTPLSYSTTYIWKVVAKNVNGSSPSSVVRSFTTKEDPTKELPFTENFNASTSTPTGWTNSFSVGTTGGATGNGLFKNLYSSSTTASALTPPVGPITANTRLDFDYRYTLWSGHPATGYELAAGDKLEIQVSTDDGVTYETIYTIDNTNHTTTNLFNTASIFLTQAKALNAGDIVKVKFLATRAAGDYYLSIDNVSIKHISDTPVFAINPTVKAFGTVSVGASDTQTFTISNQGGGTMNIQSVVLTGDLAQFSLIDTNQYPKAVGEPITVSVAFTPVAEGDFSVTLTIIDDIAKSKGNHTVTITGTGFDATIRDLPYIQTWDVPDLITAWAVYNVNLDAQTWGIAADSGSNAAKIRWNTNEDMDDWLISPPINLAAGATYTVSYKYHSSGSTFPESMKVAFGNAQNPAAMTSVIANHSSIANSTYLTSSATFTPDANGTYFLGFHGYSDADMNTLYLDDIRILLPNTQIAQVIASGPTASVTVPAIMVGGAEIAPTVAFANLGNTSVIEVSTSYGVTTNPLTSERLVLSIDGGNLAGALVTVTHNLGFIPQVIAYQLGAGEVVMANNPGDWSATTAYLVVPAAKGPYTLKIIFPKDDNDTLPVTLSSFAAVLTADLHVNIAWIAESETNHAGYNILRSEVKELSTAMMINNALIDAGTTSGTQISYQYTDAEVYHNARYYYWLEDRSLTGESTYHGPLMVTISAQGEEPEIPSIPVETKLFSAFPNPFNPSTNLRYSMKEAGDVRIDVYNLKGQLLKSFNNSHNQAGYYQVSWDGHDANGRLVGTGVYFYRMSSGNYSSTKKMIMAK